jgi:hypothetical protein
MMTALSMRGAVGELAVSRLPAAAAAQHAIIFHQGVIAVVDGRL